ncbi:MAG: hypothetical protein JSR60_17070 [Proteobacteria bacterium]|nr:hypothetical protein [Pseudomonadota bacterium]
MMRAAFALGLAVFVTAATAAPRAKGLDDARKAFVHDVETRNWRGLDLRVAWPLVVDNYGSPPRLTRAEYRRDHTSLTVYVDAADLLKCILHAPATYQSNRKEFGFDSWVVDCNGNEFYFGRSGGVWRLTAYQNINE